MPESTEFTVPDSAVPESHDGVIEACERWHALVSSSDLAELALLASDDFTCRHANGKVESKAAWLENYRRHPRTLVMGEPTVMSFGSVAVLSFPQDQVIPVPGAQPMTAKVDVVQVWRREADRWIVAAHWHRMQWNQSRPLERLYRFAPGQLV